MLSSFHVGLLQKFSPKEGIIMAPKETESFDSRTVSVRGSSRRGFLKGGAGLVAVRRPHNCCPVLWGLSSRKVPPELCSRL
jgi:hypothetical protein